MDESVAAVVVTYNRKQLLCECLEALLHQTMPLDAVFLIDNASTDGTPEMLAERGILNESRIHYLRMPQNTGGAGGFHEGLKQAFDAGYDWFWLLDDDAIASSDALEQAFKRIGEDNNVVWIAPLIVDSSGNIDRFHRGNFKRNCAGLISHQILTDEQALSAEPYHVDFCSFVGPIFKRATVERIGLPEKQLFIHHDDFEYSLRMNKAGFRCQVQPSSKIIHLQASHDLPRQRILWLSMDVPAPSSMIFTKYFAPRNLVWINKTYSGKFASIISAGMLFLHEAIRNSSAPWKNRYRMLFFMSAVADGLRGRLGVERARGMSDLCRRHGM
jgi:GT2 family glycosyltransferase